MSKAVKFDENKLIELYAIVTNYIRVADTHLAVIRAELKKLDDPEFKSGLAGGKGEAALKALEQVQKIMITFEEQLIDVRKILNDRIEKAQAMAKNNGQFIDLQGKIDTRAKELRDIKALKR